MLLDWGDIKGYLIKPFKGYAYFAGEDQAIQIAAIEVEYIISILMEGKLMDSPKAIDRYLNLTRDPYLSSMTDNIEQGLMPELEIAFKGLVSIVTAISDEYAATKLSSFRLYEVHYNVVIRAYKILKESLISLGELIGSQENAKTYVKLLNNPMQKITKR